MQAMAEMNRHRVQAPRCPGRSPVIILPYYLPFFIDISGYFIDE
jgi:hypothetical protein